MIDDEGVAVLQAKTFCLNSLLSRGGDLRAVAGLARQTFVDEDADFGATVLRAALARRVVGYWVRGAVTERRQYASQRNLMILDEIAHDRLCALLAELAVDRLVLRLVCVARDFNQEALRVL